MKEEVKFRVSHWYDEGEYGGDTNSAMYFTTYHQARRDYKLKLLKSIRGKKIVAWRIGLNRVRDSEWVNMIYFDSSGESEKAPELVRKIS